MADLGSFKDSLLCVVGASTALGKILTLDILRRQHVIMRDKCYVCKRNEEFVDYLLCHCDVAFAIWSIFSVVLGCPGVCLDMLIYMMLVVFWQAKEYCGVKNGVYVSLLMFVKENK